MAQASARNSNVATVSDDPFPPQQPTVCFLSKKAVCAKVSLTFPFVWKLIKEGKFPEGRAVGSRTLWIGSEIDDWILSRAKRSYRKNAEVA